MLKMSVVMVIICLAGAVAGQGSKVMSTVVMMAAGALLLAAGLQRGAYVVERVKVIFDASGIEARLAAPVAKVLGIALCGRVTAELCRDMGSRWAACNIEVFAVISAVICMAPLLEEVLRLVGGI